MLLWLFPADVSVDCQVGEGEATVEGSRRHVLPLPWGCSFSTYLLQPNNIIILHYFK